MLKQQRLLDAFLTLSKVIIFISATFPLTIFLALIVSNGVDVVVVVVAADVVLDDESHSSFEI